jgi:phosphoribosylformylglycinamidine synthase I
MEGTNCDEELRQAFDALGTSPEIVQLRQLERGPVPRGRRRRFLDYDLWMIPGGFSAGDYVRAGAIFAARVRSRLGREVEEFLRSGRFLGGICNGFQVLVELGLLPGDGSYRLGKAQAALVTNDSARFECRPTYCRWDKGNFAPLQEFLPPGSVLHIPSAHAEGKLVLSGTRGASLKELLDRGQVLLRWVDPSGREAGYPWNPNGSEGNVAGITDPTGHVFGLMPHPERSFDPFHMAGWTRHRPPDGIGDGRRFLEAVVRYAERHS